MGDLESDDGSVTTEPENSVASETSNVRTSASIEYALVFVLFGVSVAVGLTLFFGPRVGGLSLSLMLIAAAVARVVAVEPRPRGLVVRSRVTDISVLLILAALLAFFGQTARSL